MLCYAGHCVLHAPHEHAGGVVQHGSGVVTFLCCVMQETAYYMHHMSMLVGSYSVVVVGNYLFGFILLVVVYWKILRLIRKMKIQHGETSWIVQSALLPMQDP